VRTKFAIKALLATLVVVTLAASAAVAAPPPGAGKPPATGAGCKPKVTVVLKGALTSVSATVLGVNVKQANRHGRPYVTAAQPTSVLVNADTKVRRQGKKTLADLLVGDRVVVQARVCKKDLANGATPALTAVRVVAHPAA
jgi:hypothetical protein